MSTAANESMILATDVELLEAEAWAQLHTAFALASLPPKPTVRRWGRATALATPGVGAVAINRVIGLGLERPLDRTQLDEAQTFFIESGKTRWFLEWSPEATATDAELIASHGGALNGRSIKLFAHLRDIAPVICNPAISVVELSVTEVSTFIQIVAPALGVPEAARHGIVGAVGHAGWTYYLALEDERPVAGAAMFADGIGAWFGLCATLADARQRGAQTALLDRRITDARKHGCSWISAETAPESSMPNPSLRNMTRIGMRELYHRPWFRFDV